MRTYEDVEFHRDGFADRDSSATYENLEFLRCYFQGFFISLTTNPNLRSTIRNIRLIGCRQRGCTIYAPILEDVFVDGLNTNKQLLRAHGAVFKHVILQGKIDRVMLSNDVFPSVLLDKACREHVRSQFEKANIDYYRHVDWALDISKGEFNEMSIRGIPTHLIHRDPETQIVVTRRQVLEGEWKKLTFHDNLWRVTFDLFLASGETSIVLIAPKRNPKFQNYFNYLKLMKKAGVAEPG